MVVIDQRNTPDEDLLIHKEINYDLNNSSIIWDSYKEFVPSFQVKSFNKKAIEILIDPLQNNVDK